jgi:hypothetical protein
MNHLDSIALGLLASAFFTLIWRRMDSTDKLVASMVTKDEFNRAIDRIDKTLVVIQADMKQFYKDSGEIKGRVDEISHRIK